MLARKALAGTAGAPKVYVEDVFSTYLYTGNGSTQTITNNIDLSGEGGMVYIRNRSAEITFYPPIMDTARGTAVRLSPTLTNGEISDSNCITSFNSSGFSLGTSVQGNRSGSTYASWTFRKAEKFFDVVTYTGNGSGGRTINHNLGSAPGCIIIKCTSTTSNWMVWHRSISGQDNLYLNSTDGTSGVASDPISVPGFPSSLSTTEFNVSTGTDSCNTNGETYVAYLFAHDAGGFGDAGSDSIIKCGSYTGNGSSTGPTVTLDWEPQWLMIKRTDSAYGWFIADNMREMSYNNYRYLIANTSDAEGASGAAVVKPLATGFQLGVTDAEYNANGGTYIYIAIRRGPMKTPETGTSVFAPNYTTSTSGPLTWDTGFNVDLVINKRNLDFTNGNNIFVDRLRGNSATLNSNSSLSGEGSNSNITDLTINNGYIQKLFSTSGGSVTYGFARASKFFDIVCYSGTGSATTINHNLIAVPELIIVRNRTSADSWQVYSSELGNNKNMNLDTTAASATSSIWNNTTPTSSVFSVSASSSVNGSGNTYVAYLFASLSGVSKVGSYTGNGSSVTVTTNFQPRFILVKRTDSTGDWIVSDSARGLVAGNDPYLELNTTDAEVTNEDWVDISSTSFTVNQTTNNANVNTGTYIYLAVS